MLFYPMHGRMYIAAQKPNTEECLKINCLKFLLHNCFVFNFEIENNFNNTNNKIIRYFSLFRLRKTKILIKNKRVFKSKMDIKLNIKTFERGELLWLDWITVCVNTYSTYLLLTLNYSLYSTRFDRKIVLLK
jgi:hypothetical protein